MALYGYARVSTSDQNFTLQEQALRAACCDVVRAEKVTGTSRAGRTELQLLLDFLRSGDTLVVTRIDRLTRSIKDLQDIVYTLKERGVKVDHPFRTVKEAHETLYHFHKPETEKQANEWLMRYLLRYNDQGHRAEKHSRLEEWLTNLPSDGLRDMCTWDQFCRFAREPERRKVGIDARIAIGSTAYEVEPDMAGETVVLLWVELKTQFSFKSGPSPFGTSHSIASDQNDLLFSFFESSLVCITFSFQTLEAFCNYSISRTWRKPVDAKKGKKKEMLHHEAAERAVSTEDKLKSILPKIYDVPTPSGKAIWERFIKLKRARDACIHIKYQDQYPLGGKIDQESLFFQFLDNDPLSFPEGAAEMLAYFYSKQEQPRWLQQLPR